MALAQSKLLESLTYIAPDVNNTDNSEENSEIVNDNEEQESVNIAVPMYGKSKDGRNLAQVMTYGLTSQEGAIPLALELMNGNTSDYSHFPEFARESLGILQQILITSLNMLWLIVLLIVRKWLMLLRAMIWI